MKERLNILFPGGFKPLHSAHIMLAQNAYDKLSSIYDVHIYFIIGAKERDGIPADPTIKLMNKMFKNVPYMDVMVCLSGSPLRMAYNIAGEKEFGDGYYTLLSSTKESDYKRSEDFCKAFLSTGKYYTEGVTPLFVGPFSAPIEFTHRTDQFNNTPISSSVLRMDLANDDFSNFFSGYRLLLETRWMDNEMLESYYNDLRAHINVSVEESIVYQKLNEGGLGGHISHPYEINEMKFTDLFSLVTKLFAGEIQDITEKVDGMNLFASVNLEGEPIFARNLSHIRKEPFTLSDIERNGMWAGKPTVSDAFVEGARCIAEIFSHIPDAVNFFNRIDVNWDLTHRKWVNFEVVDPNNVNVINYSDKMVLVHSIKLVEYRNPDGIFYADYDRGQEQVDIDKIGEAIAETVYKDTSIGFTPKVLMDKYSEGATEAAETCDKILELINEYGISQIDTIGDFKAAMAVSYLSSKTGFKDLSPEITQNLARRWMCGDGPNMQWFKSKIDDGTYVMIRDFEKNMLTDFKRKINRPLEMILAKAGNKILKQIKGTINSKNQQNIKDSIKKRIVATIDRLEKEGDDKSKDRLEQLLAKMETLDNTINAIEGIVFEYEGRLIKITGSFGTINQILGMNYSLS